ncbi:MAG: IS21 family transposase, partial [Candidatus Saccharibacteria bacterium]|nr:IS21 family transposase [Rhodoferax sp.]
VAVELAREKLPPPGRVSVEHVVNVLSRLNEPSAPAPVDGVLQVSKPVCSDTEPYDRLRDKLGREEVPNEA